MNIESATRASEGTQIPGEVLRVVSELPDGFLESKATELYRLLDGPTLIHLPGKKERPLFVSTLLHGNETTGLKAIQEILSGLDLNGVAAGFVHLHWQRRGGQAG